MASAWQAVLTGADLILEELPANMPEAQARVLMNAGQALSSTHSSLHEELEAVMQQHSAELNVEE